GNKGIGSHVYHSISVLSKVTQYTKMILLSIPKVDANGGADSLHGHVGRNMHTFAATNLILHTAMKVLSRILLKLRKVYQATAPTSVRTVHTSSYSTNFSTSSCS
ncbi:hypothetical protein FRX31_006661, partial [Thalictrum thalictroides]